MEFARNEYSKRNRKVKKNANKNVEIKPQWFDEEIDSKPLSELEKQELESMLKEFQ